MQREHSSPFTRASILFCNDSKSSDGDLFSSASIADTTELVVGVALGASSGTTSEVTSGTVSDGEALLSDLTILVELSNSEI